MPEAARRTKRAGRRPGSPDTRSLILAAAKAEFADKGFDRATVRGIARAANVDPALVHHYFGSKDDLLLAALEIPIDPRELIPALTAPGLDGLGMRLITTFLSVWDVPENRHPLVAMVKAAVSSDTAADVLREGMVRMVVTAIADAIDADDATLRAQLVGSQLIGLAMARYIVEVEPLASAPSEVVAAALGPTLQRYIDGTP